MIPIGKILKTHGYKGLMRIQYDPVFRDDIAQMTAFFLEEKGEILPWFITHKEMTTKTEALIGLENIHTLEEARLLSGKALYAREDDLGAVWEEHPYSLLAGYMATDASAGEIGRILDVMELPGQLMAVIDYKGNEALVPLNEALVKNRPAQKDRPVRYTGWPAGPEPVTTVCE